MHFKCTRCPNEFCSGCGGSFKKAQVAHASTARKICSHKYCVNSLFRFVVASSRVRIEVSMHTTLETASTS